MCTGDEEKEKEADEGVDLVAWYKQSEERSITAEELGGIMRHSRDKRGNSGPLPSYATTFLWQVRFVLRYDQSIIA